MGDGDSAAKIGTRGGARKPGNAPGTNDLPLSPMGELPPLKLGNGGNDGGSGGLGDEWW